MNYLTKNYDCDTYIFNFLFYTDIIKLCLINNSLNKLILNHKIYNSILPPEAG